MGLPIAVLGSMHVCPMVDPGPKPHVGGPVVDPGQTLVFFNGMPVAVVGGKCTCVGPPDTIVKGSTLVRINGRSVARVGDTTAHGGTLVMGMPMFTAM